LGACAATAIWLGVRRHPASGEAGRQEPLGAAAQTFVGKWTFVEGTMKTDWEIQAADAQKHETSLAGKFLTVAERDGGLWATLEGDPCAILLSGKGQNPATLVSERTVCPEEAAKTGMKKNKSIQMTISLDPSGRGHVTGTSRFSLEVSGAVHEGRLEFAGVVQKQADAGP